MTVENDIESPGPPPSDDEEARKRLGPLGHEALESLRDRRPKLYQRLLKKGELYQVAWRCEERATDIIATLVVNGISPHEAYIAVGDCLDILPGDEPEDGRVAEQTEDESYENGTKGDSLDSRMGSRTSRLKKIGVITAKFHGLGAVVAFLYFSYQYSRTHGFVSWFYLGGIVPALKALIWEVFVLSALWAQPGPKNQEILSELAADQSITARITLWNLEGYDHLIAKAYERGLLETSYKTGPNGRERVGVKFTIDPDRTVVLDLDFPRQAVPGSETRVPVKIRDHNQDGEPDDFQVGLPGNPLDGETITGDGFVVYRCSREHEWIRFSWSSNIGILIIHDAASP